MAHEIAKRQVIGQHGSCDRGNKTQDGSSQVGTVFMKFKNEPEVAVRDDKYELLLELIGQRTGNDKLGGDIVMVLDMRGGMIGDKLNVMKQAVQIVIDKLSPSDRLSIITSSSSLDRRVELLRSMTPDAKAQLEYIVQNLKADGNTNASIHAALQKALHVLDGRKITTGRSGAIMLLSNGIQNEGRDATNIGGNRFPIYTFCLGHDSQVLEQIAVKSEEGKFNLVIPGNLSDVVSECLDGILSVPVHDVKLVLKPLTGAVTKTEKVTTKINKVYAGIYPQSRDDATGSVTVSFGNLYRKERRTVVADLALPAVTNAVDINALQMFCFYRGATGDWTKTNPIMFRVKRRTAPKVIPTYAKLVETAKRELESMTGSVEKYGPYGYQTGKQWSMILEPSEKLCEIIIKTGAIIDSIDFITTNPNKVVDTPIHRKIGGEGGNAEHKITLQNGEYITNISGAIGEWHENIDVTKLKIHTNLRKNGYGPYGGGPYTKYLSDFSSQVPPGGRVVGFFGTLHNNYIQSIGLYVRKDC